MKCKKGKKEIEVSEKAFRVVYKPQGYKEVKDSNEKKKQEEKTEMKQPALEDMTEQELRALAEVKGIGGTDSLNKEELILVLEGES